MEATFFTGDTVKLEVEFRDYPNGAEDGVLINPSDVLMNIYNEDRIKITEAVPVHDSLGKYSKEYTLPTTEGTIFVEWVGTVNSKPEVKRDKIKLKFYNKNL